MGSLFLYSRTLKLCMFKDFNGIVFFIGVPQILDLHMDIAVYFDLGDTLVISVPGDAGSLQSLSVLPFVPQVLSELRSRGNSGNTLRLGVISNTGDKSLDSMLGLLSAANLLNVFDEDLLVFSSVEGMTKDNPQLFTRAAARARLSPQSCVFVGESEKERKVAESVGFRVSFHPLHVFHVVEDMAAGV